MPVSGKYSGGIGARDTAVVTTSAVNVDFNADGGAVLVDLNNASSWDGTVDFKATYDGVNYFNVSYFKAGALAPAFSVSQLSAPATARYVMPGPNAQVRISCGAGTTGTLTVKYRILPSMFVLPAIDANIQVGDADVSVTNAVPISGLVADGVASTQLPVVIAGVDTAGSPLVKRLQVESATTPNLRTGIWVGAVNARVVSMAGDAWADSDGGLFTFSRVGLVAPDGAVDKWRAAGNTAPGLGAANVAPIGGDITLRASAAITTASGTSTAVDNLGWVKSFTAHMDVTAVRSGGTPNCHLDVYIQTQLASADWQDIVHFTQLDSTVLAEIVAWGPAEGNISGVGVEGSALTFDRFFAEQDAGLAEATLRVMPLGDSMRVKWVYTAGDSDTGDYTFAVVLTAHS